MSKKLTSEYIRLRTKCDRIEGIKNLNLWGCDLEDISIIRDLPNLEVISLSINRIKTLRDFANLKLLRELYIRKNMVSDLNDVVYLKKCNNLRTLWLNENPLAENKNYRAFVIKNLPQIIKLDDIPISVDERNIAINMDFDEIEINGQDDAKTEIEINFEEECKIDDQKNLNNKDYNNNYNDEKIYKNLNQIKQSNMRQSDIVYSAKPNEKKESPSPGPGKRKISEYNDVNNDRRLQSRPEYENDKPVVKIPKRLENISNPSNKIKTETVVNCIMMLINELNIEEIEKIRNNLDKTITNYYQDN